MTKLFKIGFFCTLTLILLAVFVHFQNNHIVVTRILLAEKSNRNNIRIVHLSDLQCKTFGPDQTPLLRTVKSLTPDLIVFTGDLVDAFHYDPKSWRLLMRRLPQIAPTYFVSGNHEWWKGNFTNVVEPMLKNYGVHVLRNKTLAIHVKNKSLCLTGVDDPEGFQSSQAYADTLEHLSRHLNRSHFSILLVHRPEYFDLYDRMGFDLTFAGHAHGGQFRLPFIGGLFAPGQGFLPRFSAGLYRGTHSDLILSRGLGNSVFPVRVLNYPEVIMVEI